jgi:Holliday junction resolvase RusA-like endonuclease
MQKKTILNITPMTWVRVTQNDAIFFRIPRDKLLPSGLKRLMRIERYNNYKVTLNSIAKEKRFSIQPQGTCVSFFLPMPKTWSKKKKKRYHNTLHQSKPDLKNLLSAFEDSLCTEDKYIAHYGSLDKRWVDNETGWIEVWFIDPVFEAIEVPSVEEGGHS